VRSNNFVIARRVQQERFWSKAVADDNCITDGADLRIHRFARCGCGVVEGILLREKAEGFRCCECRAERVERITRQRRIAVRHCDEVKESVCDAERQIRF
jgi:hypothetical protein